MKGFDAPFHNGASPFAGMIQAADGSFYGTTTEGGATGAGTVFKLDAAGTLTTLHSFTAGSDGGNPYAGLIEATDGSFYGTTRTVAPPSMEAGPAARPAAARSSNSMQRGR